MSETEIEQTPVLFHRIPAAAVVLADKRGTYSVHDVYAYKDGRLFAKKGSSFVLLYRSRMTSMKSVRIIDVELPFRQVGDTLGYMVLPEDYELLG